MKENIELSSLVKFLFCRLRDMKENIELSSLVKFLLCRLRDKEVTAF